MDWDPNLMVQLLKGDLDVVIGDTHFIEDKEPYRIHPLPNLVVEALARLSGMDFVSMEGSPSGLIEAPYHILKETLYCCNAVAIGGRTISSQLDILPYCTLSRPTSYYFKEYDMDRVLEKGYVSS